MKKKSFWVYTVSNILLICVLGVMAFICLPVPSSTTTMQPLYRGEKENGRVGIMFNVYQGTEYVEKILTILDTYGIPCTFFVGGIWAEKNVHLLKKMNTYGEVANHGYLHRDHATLNEQSNKEEILLCHRLVEKACGAKCTLFAPPSGSYSVVTLQVCDALGYKMILWSKDTIDWRDQDKNLIYKRATDSIKEGDLVLMHPTLATVQALPDIIEQYLKIGLVPSTVTDVLYSDIVF